MSQDFETLSVVPRPKFFTERGFETTAEDPHRLVWYSANCGFWTDDWNVLKRVGPGIPCCPICKCPGMQIEFCQWLDEAMRFDAEHPGYLKFLNDKKAHCLANNGGPMKAWESEKQRKDQTQP